MFSLGEKKFKIVNVRIDEKENDMLEELTDEFGCYKSVILREAIHVTYDNQGLINLQRVKELKNETPEFDLGSGIGFIESILEEGILKPSIAINIDGCGCWISLSPGLPVLIDRVSEVAIFKINNKNEVRLGLERIKYATIINNSTDIDIEYEYEYKPVWTEDEFVKIECL